MFALFFRLFNALRSARVEKGQCQKMVLQIDANYVLSVLRTYCYVCENPIAAIGTEKGRLTLKSHYVF